ncbi:hypothetical protein EDC05_006548, partial [Coemansia umbellata]
MDQGQITLKGMPSELKAQGTLKSALVELQSNKYILGDTNLEDSVIKEPKPVENDGSRNISNANLEDTKTEDEYNLARLQEVVEQEGIASNSNLSALQGKLVEAEEREEGYVKLEVWQKYFNACGNKAYWVILILFLVVAHLLSALQTYWIRLWVASAGSNATDKDFTGNIMHMRIPATKSIHFSGPMNVSLMHIYYSADVHGNSSTSIPNIQPNMLEFISNATHSEQAMQNQNAAYWLGIYVAFCFIEIVWAMMQWVVTFIGGLKASRNIHNQLLHSIVHATPRFFDTTPVGRIINRFSRDMQTVDFGIVSMVVSWFSGIMSLVVTFIIISSIIPMFTIGAMIISISYAVIAFYYLNTSRELKRLESNSMSPLLSLFDEVINGVSTIRAFNAKKYYIMEALNRI